jgi:hypothetical protein
MKTIVAFTLLFQFLNPFIHFKLSPGPTWGLMRDEYKIVKVIIVDNELDFDDQGRVFTPDTVSDGEYQVLWLGKSRVFGSSLNGKEPARVIFYLEPLIAPRVFLPVVAVPEAPIALPSPPQ